MTFLVGAEGLEQRFGAIMNMLAMRLSPTIVDVWEDRGSAGPMAVLGRLGTLLDDTETMQWLLRSATASDVWAIVMGYRKLVHRARRGDEKATPYLENALSAKTLGSAFRVFTVYWYRMPVDAVVAENKRQVGDAPARSARADATASLVHR